MFFIYHYFPQR